MKKTAFRLLVVKTLAGNLKFLHTFVLKIPIKFCNHTAVKGTATYMQPMKPQY